jgi:hypothetical protein
MRRGAVHFPFTLAYSLLGHMSRDTVPLNKTFWARLLVCWPMGGAPAKHLEPC